MSCSYLSDFIVLPNQVMNWLVIKVSAINLNVVISNIHSWKKIFLVRTNRKLIIITFCIIIRKNKQSFNSLTSRIKPFSYVFWIIICTNLVFVWDRLFFSMNMIYTIKKWKILRKINYMQRNLDGKRSVRH